MCVCEGRWQLCVCVRVGGSCVYVEGRWQLCVTVYRFVDWIMPYMQCTC